MTHPTNEAAEVAPSPLDVERLHQMKLGCDDGCFEWSEDRDGMRRTSAGPIHSKQAAEYARLAATSTATEEPTDD